jgi:enoyl-[acyl-carrier protein] reductase/trans-2-enoyl-CoA reductase (NAD+)
MIIQPRIRGFICTTAHPDGCAHNVNQQISYVTAQAPIQSSIGNALVLGASGGYGLASRISAAFGCRAATIGVSFEKAPSENKTASAGWYNNVAFEEAASAAGLYAKSLDGDAFAEAMKARVIDLIKSDLGRIDLVVYSLASPVRQHPRTGELHRSAIKPLGEVLRIKTLNVNQGEVHEVNLEPATDAETSDTVAVMGGEDWEYWIEALRKADVLSDGFRTVAFTYIGSELTWPIYWHGTLGKAKEDLDRAAAAITASLASLGGQAQVASLKAIVSQASSAIPVVPLYASMLFRVMKDAGLHEECIEHVQRLFATQFASGAQQDLDAEKRIRMDTVELSDAIQGELKRRWPLVTTENLEELADLEGFRRDFLKIFGFGFDGVDYEAEQDPLMGREPVPADVNER